MKKEDTPSPFMVSAHEQIAPLVRSGFGEEVRKITIKHGGTQISNIPEDRQAAFLADIGMLLSVFKHLNSQERLMKAAQKFAVGFDQNRKWSDDIMRLTYTLDAWRELALAALDFSNMISVTPNPTINFLSQSEDSNQTNY